MLRLIRNLFYLGLGMSLLGVIVAVLYALKLEKDYGLDDANLGGALWSMPARVYARPLELYVGAHISAEQLERELKLLEYRKVGYANEPLQYSIEEGQVSVYLPPFTYWDGARPARKLQVSFADGRISGLLNESTLEAVVLDRIEPLRIASIYPQHQQDRILVNLEEVPEVLVDSLIAIEDRNFWNHPGIDVKGIARSIYVTFIDKSGRQGASTLTQQFIKNHYLSNERTMTRKVKEMLMAIVLERHSSKQEILEGYINEINLGQDGERAIHGFGLASDYYFNKELKELGLHEIAMLLALVREPGNADPRRHAEYALERRNLMLRIMQERGLISAQDAELAQSLPLDVVSKETTTDRLRYPAFLDLVYQQLYHIYKKEDLTREGLNIFTTLDPQVQEDAQKALSEGLAVLEKRNGFKSGFLQSAAVVTNSGTGEVMAVIGSRVAGEQGFNRAISAKRQIGSLVKPAVFLSALEYPQLYTLASKLDDSPLNYKRGGETWSPQNYSRNYKGSVTLQESLIRSYNIPTARIALDLGIPDILSTLRRIGARENLPQYPSVSLGAVEMSVLEVSQIYETFANGGYFTPLRSIREITTLDGKVIDRFTMSSFKAIEPGPHYLVVRTMQEIPRRGTATDMKEKISPDLNIAGKTGTTDSYRDSWFAGFSGNLSTVVWVGNDQNKPTKLSGGKGALRIWMDIMKKLPLEPLQLNVPEGIVTRRIDLQSGALAGSGCGGGRVAELPFIAGSEPTYHNACAAPAPRPDEDAYYEDGYAAPAGSNSYGFELLSAPPPPPPPPANTGDPSGWFRN